MRISCTIAAFADSGWAQTTKGPGRLVPQALAARNPRALGLRLHDKLNDETNEAGLADLKLMPLGGEYVLDQRQVAAPRVSVVTVVSCRLSMA